MVRGGPGTVRVAVLEWGRVKTVAEILLLVNDEPFRDLVAACLPSHTLTVIKSPGEVPETLAQGRYALAIITNLGVSPFAAVDAVPADRACPVLFLTGLMSGRIKRDCLSKGIAYRMVPIELASLSQELRIALDEAVL